MRLRSCYEPVLSFCETISAFKKNKAKKTLCSLYGIGAFYFGKVHSALSWRTCLRGPCHGLARGLVILSRPTWRWLEVKHFVAWLKITGSFSCLLLGFWEWLDKIPCTDRINNWIHNPQSTRKVQFSYYLAFIFPNVHASFNSSWLCFVVPVLLFICTTAVLTNLFKLATPLSRIFTSRPPRIKWQY